MRVFLCLLFALQLSQAAVANTLFRVEMVIFKVERWLFVCDVNVDSYSNCSAERKFGSTRIQLNENLKITVFGGCKKAETSRSSIIKPSELDGHWKPNILEANHVAVEMLNKSRGQCGQSGLSVSDEHAIDLASRLLIELAN